MSDAIAELGLDTAGFNSEADKAIEKIKQLGIEAIGVTGNLVAMAAVVGGTLAAAIYKTRQAAKELDETLRDIEHSNPFNEHLTSANNLEQRIKSLNAEIKKLDDESVGSRIFRFIGSAHLVGGSGFDASEQHREEQREKALKAEEDARQAIGRREEQNLEVLKHKLAMEDEQAKLLESQLHYRDAIAKALEKGDGPQAVQLAREKQITDEIIKQESARKRAAIASETVGDEAKTAIGAILGDQKNQDKIDDREADRKQADLDFFHEEERKSGERALAYKAKQDKEESDFFHKQEHEMGLRALRFAEEQQKKEQRQREQQNAIRDQLTVSGVRRQDGGNAASREAVAQHFDKRIQDAIRDGDTETERLLRQQQNEALAGLDTHQALETPAQHRADVRESRRDTRNEAHASERNADLDDRIARGARGSEHSRIEERRRQNQRDAERAKNQDAARHAAKPDTSKGYGPTDRQYLKSIADALTTKD